MSLIARVQARLRARILAVPSGASTCPLIPWPQSAPSSSFSISNKRWSARLGERFNRTVVYYDGISLRDGAVMAFQRQLGLEPSGQIDQQTATALGLSIASTSGRSVTGPQ